MYYLVIIIVVRKMLFILLTVLISIIVDVHTAGKCHYLIIMITTTLYTEITVHPQSVNTTLNSTVNFTCEAVADVIVFKINNMSLSNNNMYNNKGFSQQDQDMLNGMKKRRVLLAEALEDNNNTNISCTAFGSSMNIDSDIAVLRIQGELML